MSKPTKPRAAKGPAHNAAMAAREGYQYIFRDLRRLFDMILESNGGGNSHAQLQQDIFALITANFKKGGYFVEFGATNGIDLSNTYLLETHYDWTGILAEPAPVWHADLHRNRNCHISTDCVWTTTGETLLFDVADDPELSTLSTFKASDDHEETRTAAQTVEVATISLQDLLSRYDAPRHIDYLSVDTEGSEADILQAFDFDTHTFGLITVEHNFTAARQKICNHLLKQGYKRMFLDLSRWDDWYVLDPDKRSPLAP